MCAISAVAELLVHSCQPVLLSELHWLPVHSKVTIKVASITHKLHRPLVAVLHSGDKLEVNS